KHPRDRDLRGRRTDLLTDRPQGGSHALPSLIVPGGEDDLEELGILPWRASPVIAHFRDRRVGEDAARHRFIDRDRDALLATPGDQAAVLEVLDHIEAGLDRIDG